MYVIALFKVDNSPPSAGAWAVSTDHAAGLNRHRQGWMMYSNSPQPTARLSWVGFGDPHSDILEYWLKIGSNFGSSDLINVRFCYIYNHIIPFGGCHHLYI